MAFDPKVQDEIVIKGKVYRFAAHPFFAAMPYGQEGRQGIVYKIVAIQDGYAKGLKVFRPMFHHPDSVYQSEQLSALSQITGLAVCDRSVLTPHDDIELLSQHNELLYAAVMPWVEGPTWMDVLLDKRELTQAIALHTAQSLAEVLSYMEQRGLAHCDLSAPNVMIPGLLHDIKPNVKSWIQLVDVEQMYAAKLDKPEHVPQGSPGYASMRMKSRQGWSKYADRFAGSMLLAEMLAWFDPAIREAAWGESYCDPDLMQKDTDRYELLRDVLASSYGEDVANLFTRAWEAEAEHLCPTFGEWYMAISSKSLTTASMEPLHTESVSILELAAEEEPPRSVTLTPVSVPAQNDSHNKRWSDKELAQARALEKQDRPAEALEAYRLLLGQMEEGSSVRHEVEAAAANVQRKLEMQQTRTESRKQAKRISRIGWVVAAATAAVMLGGGAAVYWGLQEGKPVSGQEAGTAAEAPHNAEASMFIGADAKQVDDSSVKASTDTPAASATEAEPVQKPTAVKQTGSSGAVEETASQTSAKPNASASTKTKTGTSTSTSTSAAGSATAQSPTKSSSTTTKSASSTKKSSTTDKKSRIAQLQNQIEQAYYVDNDRNKTYELCEKLLAIDPGNTLASDIMSSL
jgi:Predicted solute binding protein